MACGADGTLWAAGYSTNASNDSDFALWKLDSAGNLAAGFPVVRDGDAGGTRMDSANALSLGPDGSVWVTGYSTDEAFSVDMVLWKFDAQGTLAPGFPVVRDGDAGSAGGTDAGQAIALDPLGWPWVTGYSTSPEGSFNYDMVVWRFGPDGSPAEGFPVVRGGDAGGRGADMGRALLVRSDGTLWVGGASTNGARNEDLALWRFE